MKNSKSIPTLLFGAALLASPAAFATTLLVDYGSAGANGGQLASTASDFQANDSNVDLGATVNQVQAGGSATFGAFTVNSSAANGSFNTDKGVYDNQPILDGYFYDTDSTPQSTTITGLSTIPSGQLITLVLYGVGDSNGAGDAGTDFTPTYGASLGTQTTEYDVTAFVTYTFNSDGTTDELDISWTKAGQETSGFNGFSMTSVPEPGSITLLGVSVLGFLSRRRRSA